MLSRPLQSIALIAMLAIAACAKGDGDGGSDAERGIQIPSGAVAIVGDEVITKDELERHMAFNRRSAQGVSSPTDRQIKQQAIEKLLLQAAVDQEAERQGIRISEAEARGYLERAKRGRTKGDYARMLGPLTEKDLLRQLRIAALSERLVNKARRAGKSPELFLIDLPNRWKGRTRCRESYRVASCSPPL